MRSRKPVSKPCPTHSPLFPERPARLRQLIRKHGLDDTSRGTFLIERHPGDRGDPLEPDKLAHLEIVHRPKRLRSAPRLHRTSGQRPIRSAVVGRADELGVRRVVRTCSGSSHRPPTVQRHHRIRARPCASRWQHCVIPPTAPAPKPRRSENPTLETARV